MADYQYLNIFLYSVPLLLFNLFLHLSFASVFWLIIKISDVLDCDASEKVMFKIFGNLPYKVVKDVKRMILEFVKNYN